MNNSPLEQAINYGKMGWWILPCHGFDENMSCTCGRGHKDPKAAGKHAALNDWQVLSSKDEYDIKGWWDTNPNYNIALHCLKTGLFVIDIDPRSGGDESYEKLIQMLDEAGVNLPETVEATTGSYNVNGKIVRGRHIYFKCGTGELLVGNLSSLGLEGIDIKYKGYVMLPSSKHFSGSTYEWLPNRDPWSIAVAPAPEKLLQLIRSKREYKGTELRSVDWSSVEEQAEKLDIKKIFQDGISEGERNVTLYRVAVVVANSVADRNGEIDDFREEMVVASMVWYNNTKVRPPLEQDGPGGIVYLSRRAVNFVRDNPRGLYANAAFTEWAERQELIELNPQEVESILGIVSKDESNFSKNTRLLINKALKAGKSITEATSKDTVDFPQDPDAVSIEEGGTPGKRSMSDLGNARRLVDNFGNGIAYTPDLGYKVWSDGYWKADKESLIVQELTKKLPAIIKSEIPEDDANPGAYEKWAHVSRANARFRAAIESAKSDPRILVDLEDWDKDPELFGTANGVVNLRTGEFVENAPSHRISMKSNIKYIPGYRNDKWQKFLHDVTNGDKEYEKYLQRLVGYSITGYSNLDIIALMYGPPGTGKNTFIESIVKAAGEYSWPLDLSVISESNGISGNSDLYHIAELFNKRICWVDELPEGERLKENTMKKLSGSSLMSARSPGGRPFSFYLKAKTWISSNHRPPINDVAMWRRIKALPFVHSPAQMDPSLKEYLSDPERGQPAVLAWMIEGAVDYLNNPAPGEDPIGYCRVVAESTEVYKKSEDRLGTFIEEELEVSPGLSTPMQAVYAKYISWAMARGERSGTMPQFQKQLGDRRVSVEGFGKTAAVVNYTLKSITPSPSTSVSWYTENKYTNPNVL